MKYAERKQTIYKAIFTCFCVYIVLSLDIYCLCLNEKTTGFAWKKNLLHILDVENLIYYSKYLRL